jgi:O-methyltransferase
MKMDPRLERRIADALARRGWRVQKTVDGKPNPAHVWEEDAEFRRVFDPVANLTMVTPMSAYVLYGVATQALRLDAEFAEVGVYQGGTASMLARIVGDDGRKLHLFDTFTGMPDTDASRDIHVAGDFGDASLEAVQKLLAGRHNVHIRPGFFPDTATPVADHRFALVHVDVDIYRSVLDAAEFFYPRLVTGGFLVFDDYGWTSCPGARAAVDEFFATRAEHPVYLPTGQALVVKL